MNYIGRKRSQRPGLKIMPSVTLGYLNFSTKSFTKSVNRNHFIYEFFLIFSNNCKVKLSIPN